MPGRFLTSTTPTSLRSITKTWCGMASKKYPTQIQVDADGTKSEVSKLNDGAALGRQPADGETYYIVAEIFTQTYPRILIRRKEQQ